MNLEQQKELISLYNQYQATGASIIKTNLKNYMDNSGLKPGDISEQTGITVQTIYQLRKIYSTYKPDLITSIIICDMLKISITAILQGIEGLDVEQHEPKTKWTEEVMQEFVRDYNNSTIDEVCQKYSITPRTAIEYNKNFVRILNSL